MLSPKTDPDVKIVVADSDSVPGLSGEWISGVFLVQDGVIRPIDDYRP